MSLGADEAKALATGDALDYEAIGFRCGLEIHQQLATGKLFSPCPSQVIDPDEVARSAVAMYDRRLKATQSEMGETDAAAMAEAKRRRRFRYLAIDHLTSLVELDEEPPHPIDEDALDVTLTFAGMVGARPADEVHVMRKTVIDGSNTSGFQRTALVATGGSIDAPGGDVPVWTIAVEEDSARKFAEEGGLVYYTLDRLGIPLIEVATGPAIIDPSHAQATAARIGALLRATGKAKRGLGTIRQDLNVSVAVGDRVEIKGCQDLRAVPRVIENECRRQLWLHFVKETLLARGFEGGVPAPIDVSAAFKDCQSKMVQGQLKKGAKVMGLVLPHWEGLVQGASKDGPRMGREFADHAKVAAGVKGIFHSDELPAYGIEASDVAAVTKALALPKEAAFILCVADAETATTALEAVAERARAAIGAPPREVRAAQPDDSTRYMRPLPGAARMYPETDVPPRRIPAEHWQDVLARLPMRPEERVAALVKDHGVSTDVAEQLVREGSDGRFEAWVQDGAEPALVARLVLQILPGLADQAADRVPETLAALAEGRFAKEALGDVLAAYAAAPDAGIDAAIAEAGAEAVDAAAVEAVVKKVIADRMDFVKERGMAAMGPLMGPVMAESRGKADGALVSKTLKQALQEATA